VPYHLRWPNDRQPGQTLITSSAAHSALTHPAPSPSRTSPTSGCPRSGSTARPRSWRDRKIHRERQRPPLRAANPAACRSTRSPHPGTPPRPSTSDHRSQAHHPPPRRDDTNPGDPTRPLDRSQACQLQ
jgi:hypothetical protein